MKDISKIISGAAKDKIERLNESAAVVNSLKVHANNALQGWTEHLKNLGFEYKPMGNTPSSSYGDFLFHHPVGVSHDEIRGALEAGGFDYHGIFHTDPESEENESFHHFNNRALGILALTDHGANPSTGRYHNIMTYGNSTDRD